MAKIIFCLMCFVSAVNAFASSYDCEMTYEQRKETTEGEPVLLKHVVKRFTFELGGDFQGQFVFSEAELPQSYKGVFIDEVSAPNEMVEVSLGDLCSYNGTRTSFAKENLKKINYDYTARLSEGRKEKIHLNCDLK